MENLSDKDLLDVVDAKDPTLLKALTPDEQTRMSRVVAKRQAYQTQLQRTDIPPDIRKEMEQSASGDYGTGDVVRNNMRYAPAVGATIGGAAGGPGGAALGTAVGDWAKNVALPDEAPKGTKARMIQTAGDAGAQAILGAAGDALVTGAKGAGHWLMDKALHGSKFVDQFPNVIQDAIGLRTSVSKGGQGTVEQLLQKSSDVVDQMVASIPNKIAATDIAKRGFTRDAMRPVMDQGLPDDAVALMKQIRGFLMTHSNGLAPERVQALKEAEGKLAKATYDAIAKGGGAKNTVDQVLHVGLNQGAKQSLEAAVPTAAVDVPSGMAGVPENTGIAGQNQVSQRLIGLRNALRHAQLGNANDIAYHAAPPAVGALTGGLLGQRHGGYGEAAAGAAAGALLGTPQGMSRAALALTNPGVQAFLAQLPRQTAHALVAGLLDAPQETPNGGQ